MTEATREAGKSLPVDELAYASAMEIAAAIRQHSISSRAVTDFFLDRIERLDGSLNVVVTVDAEGARRAAEAADAVILAGGRIGPLHGVPMTVKDSLSTAGMRTTAGAPELAEHVPEVDADPVLRLRQAGAIIIGKTNLPIYAGDVQTFNDIFGRSNNPWDVSRTVGGSSGGSAGALAAGFTPLEVGSDIGGSIRNPAHSCGVMGHKPSFGIVSARGQIPGAPGTLTQADLAVVGPMARTVDDLELGLDILAGPDRWQDTAWRLELPPARHQKPEKLRLAAWLDDDFCPPERQVLELLQRAVEQLAAAGASVSFEARPDFDLPYASRVFDELLGAALCAQFTLAEIEEMAVRPGTPDGALGVAQATLRHRAWLSANERRLQMRRKWRRFFDDWDAILLPVSPVAAIPHDSSMPMSRRTIQVDGETRSYSEQLKWMGLTGVSYLPATVVPVGRTSAGLPVGLQIAGPYLEDRTTLQVGRILSALNGGFETPPGF